MKIFHNTIGKKRFICIFLVLTIAVSLAACKSDAFEGTKTKNPDKYLLDFTYMNQQDEHTMQLDEGDRLKVKYEIEKGNIDVIIGMDGQEPVYTGEKIKTFDFYLTIQKTGEYKISVDAKNAKGKLSFTLEKASSAEEEIPAAYTQILQKYANALSEKWDQSKLMENDLNFMIADCYGEDAFYNIGYRIEDLDNNGITELLIGTMNTVTDDFYGKLIFDLYTIDEEDNYIKVFSSQERNRYYYAGNDLFANMGSNSAADSINTTLKYNNAALTDTGVVTEQSKYVQAELKAFSQDKNQNGDASQTDSNAEGSLTENDSITLPILDEINKNTTVGTAGAYLKAVKSAAQLLDWAYFTGLDPEEIKSATADWLMNKGNDEQVEFAEKMTQVDNACKDLYGSGAEELLATAGYESDYYPWDDSAKEIVDIIMEVVGLR